MALTMVRSVLSDLRASGIRTVYLWVLDGNDPAVGLYVRLGFVSTGADPAARGSSWPLRGADNTGARSGGPARAG
ncbi:MAG TPA: GNAT family N-acetyltransferase [Streptosporangiaceae bacterium]|nr:GNAT family N-acetyltransferase [Streptosporangiaceae bacterium]